MSEIGVAGYSGYLPFIVISEIQSRPLRCGWKAEYPILAGMEAHDLGKFTTVQPEDFRHRLILRLD
jgi:hypothetical protein